MKYSQKAWIVAQLQKGRTLTPAMAMDGCGTMRLAAYIYDLRTEGYNILTKMIFRKDGTQYATYKLVKGKK
jgi:hypothetical protein